MRVSVTFRGGLDREIALKERAQDKLERLRHLWPRPMQAHLVLNKERFVHVAELTLSVDGALLAAVAKDEDPHAAVDAALGKIGARLRRLKGKLTDHRPPEHRRAERVRRARRVPQDALAIEPPGPRFTPIESYPIEALTAEAAVAEMERRGLSLLLFKNARTKRPNVVYRHLDGQYGLVESKARTR